MVSVVKTMRFSVIILIFLSLLCAAALRAEIAVIPYKIDNPSSDFPETTGGEYSRLLAVASILAKEDIEVTPPRDIDIDLEKMKLSSQDVITKDDLALLGKTYRIDYILLGVLSRGGGTYRSESLLYSVRDGKIIIRVRVADKDLFRLAEKEIREALVTFPNKQPRRGRDGGWSATDVLFLLDMSYQMSRDWASVKSAVIGHAARLIDTLRLDTRVYVVPFSDRISNPTGSVSVNSITALTGDLDKLKPAGGAGAEDFMKAMQYSVGGVRWRAEADKAIIIISNSNISPRGVEKYGHTARKKGIAVSAISLGGIPGDQSEALGRLATVSGGHHAHAAYHQKLYDAAGEAVEVYMENGRLFKSRVPDGEWEKGLFETTGSGRHYGKPKSFADEVFYEGKKFSVTPYTLPQGYTQITMERIINQEEWESNIGRLVPAVSKKGSGRRTAGRTLSGKALVSDGKISLWIMVHDDDFMNYFLDKQKTGHVSPIGVIVKKDPGSPYGITLVPAVKELTADYIPRCLATGLGDIVKRSEYYSTRGLMYPPVWFVNVKIDNAEKIRGSKDIRGK
jgi:hypothetical protein